MGDVGLIYKLSNTHLYSQVHEQHSSMGQSGRPRHHLEFTMIGSPC